MSLHYPWFSKKKAEQRAWLTNCLAVWPATARAMGIPQAEVDAYSLLLLEMLTLMNEADQFQIGAKAVNDWRNAVLFGPETGKVAPPPPIATLPSQPTINEGFFDQLKRMRGRVMSDVNYTEAIGESLGFVGAVKQHLNPADATPDFRVVASTDYWINLSGSLQGFDAVDVEMQRKGSANWDELGYLTRHKGGFQITPAVPGTAEICAIRCRFVEKNQAIGNYSPTYTVTVS